MINYNNSSNCLNHCLDLSGCVTIDQCREYVERDYIFPSAIEWIFIILYMILFAFGLIGNALVCYVIWSSHHMQTVVNIFIFNLAVADFLVILFCLPPTLLADVTESWYMGESMCKLIPFIQTTSVTVSVLTLSAISVERYFAICKPWRELLTSRRIFTGIIFIWLTGVTVSVPDLLYNSIGSTFDEKITFYLKYCKRDWRDEDDMKYSVFILVVLYSMPICLMAFTYSVISRQLWRKDLPGTAESEHRPVGKMSISSPENQLHSRQRAAKMLMTIVVVFAVCYLPVHVLNLLRKTYTFMRIPHNVIVVIFLTSHFLCYFNSAVNPVIYNFMSAKFRKEFQSVLHLSKCPCSRSNSSHTMVSTARNRSSLPRSERYELNTVSTRHGWISTTTNSKKNQNPQEKYG